MGQSAIKQAQIGGELSRCQAVICLGPEVPRLDHEWRNIGHAVVVSNRGRIDGFYIVEYIPCQKVRCIDY